MDKKIIKKILREKRVDVLAKYLFDVELPQGQQDIVKSIVFPDHNRVCISAMTRYGKSFGVSVGVCINIYLKNNKKHLLIAPTNDQAKVIRSEIAKLIVNSPQLQQLIDERGGKTGQRLRKEVSKKKITFKNGCEIRTLSAAGDAKRLMGFGGDVIIMDESVLIDEEVYNKRIFRMLGDNPGSKLIELSNPWHDKNHFGKHWKSERFHNIRIDYKQAIEEGRVTEEFIQEAKENNTKNEFKVLYEAEFPEDTEDTLIKWNWIEEAIDKKLDFDGKIEYGLDVAREGNDLTVLKKILKGDEYVKELDTWSWQQQKTMQTVGKVRNIVGDSDLIKVDEIGVGGGVVDRMEELGMNVKGVKVSQSPDQEKHRFSNKKAQYYFDLRSLLEEGRISLTEHDTTINELDSIRTDFTSTGKLKIIDPNKSPDFSDALMLAIAEEREPFIGIV